MRSASWGNAGTLGCSSRTVPLATLSEFGKTLKSLALGITDQQTSKVQAKVADEQYSQHCKNMFVMGSTLLDPYFYLWCLTFARTLLANHDSLSTHWQAMNRNSQAATFELAEREPHEHFLIGCRILCIGPAAKCAATTWLPSKFLNFFKYLQTMSHGQTTRA